MPPVKSPTKKPTTTKKPPTKQELEELEKQKQQEEEAEKQRLLELERVRGPRSFQETDFIEQCIAKENVEQLADYLSNEMRLDDFVVNLRNSILLDFYVYNLDFAREHAFVGRKAVTFLSFMEDLRNLVIQEDKSQLDSVDFVKQKLVEYSKPSIRQQSPGTPEDEPIAQEHVDNRPKTGAPAKTPARPKSKGGKRSKEQEEAERLQKEEEERQRLIQEELQRKAEEEARIPIFNVDEIGAITNYVTSGVLQHYKLYSYVFNQSQHIDTHHCHLSVETMASCIPLALMLPEEEYLEAKNKEREEKESAEKTRLEEQARLKHEREEAARIRYEKEEEELNAPKLTSDQLQEIANYLKYHMQSDINGKRDELIERVADIQGKVDAINRPKSKQDKNKPKPKK